MRFALAVAVCGGLLLAGCGGGSSSGSGQQAPILPPVANAGGPYAGMVGTPVTFNGSGSKDPQSQALTYAWSFGDGGTGTGATPTHTYMQVAGQASTVYTVSLTVQDTSGYSGQAGTTATIQGETPLSDAGLTGVVATGTTPIVGAHVYLYAANTTGYGASSISLLSYNETATEDSNNNAYVVTGALGNFTMSGDYTCTSGQQLYIYALGGTAGTQAVGSAGLLAAIGNCPASSSTVVAQVNEVSTVAAAYALAGFATDALHVSSSGTALALTGIGNAFANAGNLAVLSTGVALTTTPAKNGTVPQAEIDSLANILSVCVNPTSYSAISCSSLLGDALANGTTGNAPTDTATAAIYIAHNPGSSLISDIYNLAPSVPVYTPVLGRQPNDFTVAISYSGGGLNTPQAIAIDGSGNAWIANEGGSSVTKLSSAGAVVTGSPYSGGGISSPYGIAIDLAGDAWIANSGNGSVTEYSATGTALSGTNGFTGCNLSGPKGIAIDGSNDVWIPDYGHNDVCVLSNAGAVVSTLGTGYTGGGLNNPDAIAIDGSGNAWVANYGGGGSVSKFSNAGAVLGGANGYTGSGLHEANGVATDANGSAWITNLTPSSVTEIGKSGTLLSGTNGITGGALSSPVGVAVDGSGNVWVANQSGNTVTEFSNVAAAVISGSTGYGGATGSASGIAIDGSGNVWVGNSTQGSVTVYIGAATPVVTPLAVAVKNNTVGARP
ncbi:MAG: PKD domain-containing protein [Acidobacteriaceae bacterium]|jgi:sugar lactone lactonase YvrE